ncbi:hypothetical protein [Streptosporangium canum]|uniref:hypothetical protein n=1 Tax=Streptosporangium canum TaxID=324952 RepID=UPI0037B60D7B
MIPTLIIPILVTTDLPPETDLAVLGRYLADAVTVLHPPSGPAYLAHLQGRTFWLDRPTSPAEPSQPAPIAEQLRFAALLGFLTATAPPAASAKDVLADARTAITAAVAAVYGDFGSPPAVLAISGQDVRERTPGGAVPAVATDPALRWVRAAHMLAG